jgi:hypothetical protein
MERVSSITDEQSVDPRAAESTLDRLAQRTRDGAVCAACAAAAALVLVPAGDTRVGFPVLAGAVAGALIALFAYSDRQALLARLLGQRSAYAIPDVARMAERVATPAARSALAAEITRLVLEADGVEPRNPLNVALDDRVRRHADDLLSIAFLLAGEERVHPATVVLVHRLVGSQPRSPLLNRELPERDLGVALQRVRCAMSPRRITPGR